MAKKLVFVFLILSVIQICLSDELHRDIDRKFKKKVSEREAQSSYWHEQAQETLKKKLATEYNTNTAKNVIFFIGDGMSIPTVTATRVYMGNDESFNLSFDEFPSFGYSKTYCLNRQVADSACTATAFLSGVKVNYGTIGVDSNIQRYDCDGFEKTEYHTPSIGQWAIDAGKDVGIVTTTRITHATPSAMYAHSGYRYWEQDQELMEDDCDTDKVDDIAEQFVYSKLAQQFKVVLGGGRSYFINETEVDEEGQKGQRSDGKNLMKEWEEIHSKMGRAKYVWKRDDLMNIDVENTDYLLGMFEGDYVQYELESASDPDEPTLVDMVEIAMKMLSKSKNGYFLFVEGGRIDTAHHGTYARLALDETRAYSNAINYAKSMTDEKETLIVVSADHAHTMTISGYPDRGQDVLGIAQNSKEDGLPYTTLSYINGPGYSSTYNSIGDERRDISGANFTNPRLRYYGLFPLSSETHGGDDVGVWANGPWNHLFIGTYEQNVLAYMIAFAMKIGPYAGGAASTFSLAIPLLVLCLVQVFRMFN